MVNNQKFVLYMVLSRWRSQILEPVKVAFSGDVYGSGYMFRTVYVLFERLNYACVQTSISKTLLRDVRASSTAVSKCSTSNTVRKREQETLHEQRVRHFLTMWSVLCRTYICTTEDVLRRECDMQRQEELTCRLDRYMHRGQPCYHAAFWL